MKLTFDSTPIDHKPDNKEYPYRVFNMVRQLDTNRITELLYLISHQGYAYKNCATSGSKETDFISQELLTLDFDNGISVDEVLNQCAALDLLPMLIYFTFSHNEEHPRFRLIFHLNEVITDYRLAKTLQLSIVELFPETDPIQDVCHIYQGSVKGEYGYQLNNYISPHDVIVKACKKIRAEGSKNFKRNLQRRLLLKEIPKPSNFLQKSGNSYNYIIGQPDFLEEVSENYQYDFFPVNFQDEPIKQNTDFVWNFLQDNCELWKNCNSGEHWMAEPELFFFASSLKGMKGSNKRLNNLIAKTVELHPGSYNSAKIQNLTNSIKTAKPLFRRCAGIKCPYSGECKYKTVRGCQPLANGYVQQIERSKHIPLDEAERELRFALENAFTGEESFTIIKAQTGLGKTTALMEYLQQHKSLSVCLAVPTHKLKDEIMEKVRSFGLDFEIIPELDTSKLEPDEQAAYNSFLKVGNYRACSRILWASKNPDIMEYCRLTDNFNRGWLDRVIITHKRAFLKKRITNDVLVVDEDILLKSVESVEVKLSDIQTLCGQLNDSILNKWFERLTTLSGLQKISPLTLRQTRNVLDELPEGINYNVRHVLRSALCFVDKERDSVLFVNKNHLPQCKKIILLSATIDDYIARYILYPIKPNFIEIPRAEQQGRLQQYIEFPSSRQGLSDGGLMNNYNHIKSVFPKQDMPVITFKKFENEFKKNGVNVVGTFGGIEGLNFLEGTDIAIIGTYRVQEISYLLFAKMIDSTVETRDLETSNQIVQYNGYRFHLYTFNHPIVRQVQLYMINSELEQCVGRSRILRNNNDVHLVAKLPLQDAIIKNAI